MPSEKDARRTTRARFGVDTLKISVLFGLVMAVFTVISVALELYMGAMLVVGWLCFVGLATIGVVNYLDGRNNAQ